MRKVCILLISLSLSLTFNVVILTATCFGPKGSSG